MPLPTLTPFATFNPTVLWAEGKLAGDLHNFGHLAVDERARLTFRVIDKQGAERYKLALEAQGAAAAALQQQQQQQ